MKNELNRLVKKIDKIKSETCCLYVAYVPDDMAIEKYDQVRAQLSQGADAGCNFIVVPESIKIQSLPKDHDLEASLV